MESTNAKIAAFILLVLAFGACLCVAFLKFSSAANAPEQPLTTQQKLKALEKSAPDSKEMRNFIHTERERRSETRDAEEAVFE